MEVKFNSARDAFANPIMKPLAKKVKADGGKLEAARTQPVDKITLSYQNVLTAEQEGYIDFGDERYSVSPELAAGIRQAYDRAAAQNEGTLMRNLMLQNMDNAKKQGDAMASQMDSLLKALAIFKRIASGGRVPPEDEQFLMNYSQEMYMMAKMQALQAKEHEKYDSVLEDEEETEEGEVELDGTVHSVEASVSGGEVVSVAEVSAVATE